jgi:hypothetical protein
VNQLEFPFAPLLLLACRFLARPVKKLRFHGVIGKIGEVHAVVPIECMDGAPGIQAGHGHGTRSAEVGVQVGQQFLGNDVGLAQRGVDLPAGSRPLL